MTKRARLASLGPRVAVADLRTARPPQKVADSFYLSPEWRTFVEALKVQRFGAAQNARCQDRCCKYVWRHGIRLFGDHIIEIKDGGAKLDPGNVLFRCGSCHTRKTVEERVKRDRVR